MIKTDARPDATGAKQAGTRQVRSVCPYCGVGCGIVMDVKDGQIVRVRGDKDHPANAGRLCTKGSSCNVPVQAKGRADKAHLRRHAGGPLTPVGIDEAIAVAAKGLRTIIDRDGPDAVSLYVSGQMSLEAQYLANKLCKGFIGTNNIESNSRLCMASAATGYKLSLGADGPAGSYDDFDQADLFFVIGANMADCHPILFLRMMDRVKAGAKLIVVDPRRTATADKADLFLQTRPGTDLALLNGLLHLLVANGKTDPEFIARHTTGWDAMPEFLADYDPASVAAITGIDPADLARAAEWIGASRRWMSCWTMGLNQSTRGTWNTNALCNLHLATGAILMPGAGPFSLTGQPNAMGGREMGYMGPGLPGQRSTLSEADRAFVEAAWAIAPGTLRGPAGQGTVALFDDMAAGKIKACWVICTNPVASVANRKTVLAGLEAAELVITQDAFLETETNAHADVILPGALWAEADGVMINSERNMTLARQAVPPPGEALADWDIIARMGRALGYEQAFAYENAGQVFDEIRAFANPATGYDVRGASHERLREDGPVQWPCAPGAPSRNPIRYRTDDAEQPIRFPLPEGKARFWPRPHMPAADLPDEDFPFVLNTGRLQHQWHTLTKTGTVPTLNKLNPGPFVEINPEDARALGLGEGDRVEVCSRRGRAVLPAVITDRVLPGACFAPFHWNDMFGPDLAINAVTSDAVDPLSLQPEFKFSAVALARVDAAAQPAAATPPGAATPQAHAADALVAQLALTAPAPVLNADEQAWLSGYVAGLRRSDLGGLPTLPASAPLAPASRHYINGLLAGLYARSAPEAAPAQDTQPAPGLPVLVAWASQTGTAEDHATRLAATLEQRGYAPLLRDMARLSPADLAASAHALFVASTFGDGDAPDNAAAFWNALQGEGAPGLETLAFAVLAFGDSTYDAFCGFGRKLDARLEALGARRLTERTDCEPDDDAGPEAWLTRVLAALPAAGAEPAPAQAAPAAPAKSAHDRKNPWAARLSINQLLSGVGAQKEVRRFGFDLAGSGITYEAGDALGVIPRNCPEMVEAVLAAAGLDGEAPVKGHDQGLGDLLLNAREIARPARPVLEALAAIDPKAPFAALLVPEARDGLDHWLWGRQLADVLRSMKVRPDAQALADCLRPLAHRLYSISSSPKVDPDSVELTVSTVRWQHEGHARKGTCSTFLADRCAQSPAPIFVQAQRHFKLPDDPCAPVIMIGPGTGIAPFRAFLQDRQASGARGRNWLFFGEQHAASDFYYRDEIEAWQRDGHLARLDLAFSRDQADKIYVQHRMIEQGAQLWRWLNEGAHVYVCGDASRMAADVEAALKTVAARHGGLATAEQGTAFIDTLRQEGRYRRDTY